MLLFDTNATSRKNCNCIDLKKKVQHLKPLKHRNKKTHQNQIFFMTINIHKEICIDQNSGSKIPGLVQRALLAQFLFNLNVSSHLKNSLKC